MQAFTFNNGSLHAEGVALTDIAGQYGTPAFVYSRSMLEQQWHAYTAAFSGCKHLVCYAVKANSNIAILNLLARLGSGFDVVSGGELQRVLAAGGNADKTVFSGVGKTRAEMRLALETGIKCFNVESVGELQRLDSIAGELSVIAPVSIRVNPDVDPDTHPYIATGLRENKFGISCAAAGDVFKLADDLPNLKLTGIDCHIGSQITTLGPYADAMDRLLLLVRELGEAGIVLEHMDIGGGLGIRYADETPPDIADLGRLVAEKLGTGLEVIIEPGRSIMGVAGLLLTRVEYLKCNEDKRFAIVDAAMNDLIRPSLYNAWHDIVTVSPGEGETCSWDIVGPVCESADFLGLGRQLALREGDLLAVMCTGAYGFVMSSNYNSRARAVEVLVDGTVHHVIRRREQFEDQLRGEQLVDA